MFKRLYVLPFVSLLLLAGCSLNQTFNQAIGLNTNLNSNQKNFVPVNQAIVTDNTVPAVEETKTLGDAVLVGSWQSDCLVPDPNSDWAEQHFFTIQADGIATHKRNAFYKKACTAPDMVTTTQYSYTIPKIGQINLTDHATSETAYDIYQATTAQLLFGHGFRNKLSYPPTNGGSESDRISTLNNYIVYLKK